MAFPGDARLRQLLALALARSGASSAAIPLLEALRAEGHADEETIGLLARSYKDLWAAGATAAAERAGSPGPRLRLLRRGVPAAPAGIWTGINAATMALLLGRKDEAAEIARVVSRSLPAGRAARIRRRPPTTGTSRRWRRRASFCATCRQAEAAYVRAGRIGRAPPGRHRLDAAQRAPDHRARTASTARAIEHALRLPRVVAFAGHIIDAAGSRRCRDFPPAAGSGRGGRDPRSARAISTPGSASRRRPAAPTSSSSRRCASGRARPPIILPYNRDQFERDSVDVIPGADWPARYARELAAARDVVLASDQRMATGEMSYEYAVLLIEGLAGVRADELDAELVRLVLWDGLKASADAAAPWPTVERWRRDNQHVEVIDLAALVRDAALPVVVSPESAEPRTRRSGAGQSAMEADIVALLFADAKGFSGLREDQIPAFVEGFLGTVADTLARDAATRRVLKNTWGDGLYFVFDSVRDAGVFALDLADAVAPPTGRSGACRRS